MREGIAIGNLLHVHKITEECLIVARGVLNLATSACVLVLPLILIQLPLPAGEGDPLGEQLDHWQRSPVVQVRAICIDVRLLREEELEETHLLVLTGQVDTQQHQILAQAGFGECAVGHLTVIGEPLHSVFRVVVVPGVLAT